MARQFCFEIYSPRTHVPLGPVLSTTLKRGYCYQLSLSYSTTVLSLNVILLLGWLWSIINANQNQNINSKILWKVNASYRLDKEIICKKSHERCAFPTSLIALLNSSIKKGFFQKPRDFKSNKKYILGIKWMKSIWYMYNVTKNRGNLCTYV